MTSTTVTTPTAAAGSVEQLIADEHAAVRVHLRHLGDFARALAGLDEVEVHKQAAPILDFLSNGLLPHAAAEEQVLYPAIDHLIGEGATRTMSLDHEAIAALIKELGAVVDGQLGPEQRAEAQRVLFVLEGFVTTHLWKEEAAFVPLLARLDPAAYASLHAGIAAHAGGHEHTH